MRVFGRIFCSIWNDPDFKTLSGDAQHLYMMLMSQGEISSCGVLPITFRRWSNNATDTPIDRLSNAFTELCERRYLVADWDREEVLLRSFIKWDEGYKVPKRLTAIKTTAKGMGSAALVQVIVDELDKLGIPHDIPRIAIDTPTDTGIDTRQSPVTLVGTYGRRETEPETGTVSVASPRSTRGTRLPDDWQPDARLVEWVQTHCPAVNGRAETEKFRDYWHSKPGKDGTKTDWDATFRNWMRTAEERAPGRPQARAPQSTTDQRVAAGLDLARRLAERGAKEITA